MQKANEKKKVRPAQHQQRPGLEFKMKPLPEAEQVQLQSSGKLAGKTAFITGGDSGIGKAVALLFAKEGADVAIVYLNEHEDAKGVQQTITEKYGRECLLIPTDISKETNCKNAISKTIKKFRRLDILVNNAAVQFQSKTLQEISSKQLELTFATNIFSMFWICKAALPHLKKGSSIINTTSVTAYRGSASLMDYSSTKGAIVSFTRSLSANLVEKDIRVNAVAPGPIWTPLVASGFAAKDVAKHGSDSPMKRSGEPSEVAPCFLFLAGADSSYMTGQVLHPNGGEVVNG